jgi:hypothetical protein
MDGACLASAGRTFHNLAPLHLNIFFLRNPLLGIGSDTEMHIIQISEIIYAVCISLFETNICFKLGAMWL